MSSTTNITLVFISLVLKFVYTSEIMETTRRNFAFSKNMPYHLNYFEALYREFINVVSEESIVNSNEIIPSIIQSVQIKSDNFSEDFFKKLVWIDHYEAAYTTINILANNINEVSGLLNQIAEFYKGAFAQNISQDPHYQTIIIIPYPVNAKGEILILSQSYVEEKVLSKTDPIAVRYLVLDSSVYLVFVKTGDTNIGGCAKDLRIWELYSVKNKTFLNELEEKEFTVSNGKLLKKSKFVQRQDWAGAQISCASFSSNLNENHEIQGVAKFEVGIERQANGKYELKSGLSADIFSDFEKALNFTRNVLPPFDYTSYSNFDELFAITSGLFDISISHFGINPNRIGRITPLAPTYYDGIVAYFVQPPAHAFRNIYTSSFAPSMWGMLIANWILILFSFKLISFMRRSIQVSNQTDYCTYEEEEDNEMEIKDLEIDEQVTREAFWWAIAATCQQGWYMTPATTPCRSVFFSGLLFSFLCYAAYTATIVSQLWDNVVPVKTMEELLKNSKHVYFQKNSDVAKLIQDGVVRDFAKIRGTMKLVDIETAFKKVVYSQPGTSCAIDWPEYFLEAGSNIFKNKHSKRKTANKETTIGNENAEVHLCKRVNSFRFDYLLPKAAMYVPKKSPFRKILNFRIFVGTERGLFRRYWKEYLKNTRVRCLEEPNATYALGIFDTWIVFAILLSGYASSLTILCGEIVDKKKTVERGLHKLK